MKKISAREAKARVLDHLIIQAREFEASWRAAIDSPDAGDRVVARALVSETRKLIARLEAQRDRARINTRINTIISRAERGEIGADEAQGLIRRLK